jgi:hypothetical protein
MGASKNPARKCWEYSFWIFVWNFLQKLDVQGTRGKTVWGLARPVSRFLSTIADCFFMGFELDCMGEYPKKQGRIPYQNSRCLDTLKLTVQRFSRAELS